MMHLLSIKCFIIIIICVRFFCIYVCAWKQWFLHYIIYNVNDSNGLYFFSHFKIRILLKLFKHWNYCQFWWKILSRWNVRALISNTSPIRLSQYFLLKMLKIKNKASQTYLFLLTLKICIILHPIAQ